MKRSKKIMQTVLLPAFVCLLMLAGCAAKGTYQALKADQSPAGASGRMVQAGDTAAVHYLCRLHSGEVVAATDPVAEGFSKSNLYMQQEATGPLSIAAVNAVDAAHMQTPYEQRSLEQEISHQLAPEIVGMKEGDTRAAEIKAETAPAHEAHRYIARLTRVRTRPKEMKMPKGEYEYSAKRPPEVGQEFSYDPDFPGRVESVSDEDVTIRLFATPGAVIETPFGLGLIREEGQDYKVDIEARKGALVRAGALTGRITDIDDKSIIVDFGNAFGNETLVCDVTVEKIADENLAQSGEQR